MRLLLAASVSCLLAACSPPASSQDGGLDAAATPDASPDALSADAGPRPIAFQPGSPWPKFRGNAAQDGLGTVHVPAADAGAPDAAGVWSFHTGKGIFSSPVVGADGTVYVGSADRSFYALRPDGSQRWKFDTGEIIDSSGLLDDLGRIYVGSGDGHLYALDAATGRQVWSFQADDPSVNRAYIRWFEGNVALGPDGRLVVPNDNFFLYALDRASGSVAWRFRLSDQTWSLPAVDDVTGNLFVGNNNLLPALGANTFALSPEGGALWRRSSTGSVAASPMLHPNGLVMVGGFDGYLRAYDRRDGTPRWTFGARDHLYASPARLPNGTVIQAAADGTVYALDPDTGAVRWAFDTPDAIRASPAVDADGHIYVGGGDGRLYVINPDGTLRFALQLIADPRNDLNASPALGRDAVYLAGESGEVFGVPYDYCLRPSAVGDTRCRTTGGEGLADSGAELLYTTQLGGTLTTPPDTVDPNAALTFSLFVRERGDTRLALLDTTSFRFTTTPTSEATVDVSADRRFLVVTPRTRWNTDSNGRVQLAFSGNYLVNPMREGLRTTGGTVGGTFARTFSFAVRPARASAFPLPIPAAPGAPAGIWEISRLAAPLPTILPSYNQIGFDSLHYLVGVVEGTQSHAIGWLVGAQRVDPGPRTVVDPATRAVFPVELDWQEGALTLHNEGGLRLEVMNLTLAFQSFRLSASLDASGVPVETPRVTVRTVCGDITMYGPFLRTLGFCNPDNDVLSVSGAALLTPHEGGTQPAPQGVGSVALAADATGLTATITGATLRRSEHAWGLLLVDPATARPVTADYGLDTTSTATPTGEIATVRLAFGTHTIPANVRAYLMVDAYPAARANVTVPGR